MAMLKAYLHDFLATPQRVWRWSQQHPYESVGYGLILLLVSIAARPLISIAALIAVIGGLMRIFGNDQQR